MGDVDTLTVDEYLALSRPGRLGYRLMRNPARAARARAAVGAAAGTPAWFPPGPRRFWRQIIATDIVLVAIIGGLCALVGWRDVLLVQLPSAMLAGAAGSVAVLRATPVRGRLLGAPRHLELRGRRPCRGSSHLKLPKILQFFTGNIGLHHVHHLSPRIPNYNLQRAHDENPVFHDVPTLHVLGRHPHAAAEALRRAARAARHVRRSARLSTRRGRG